MKAIRTIALAASVSLIGLQAMAADVELRLSHWVPATHPIQKLGIEPWVKSVEEASQGRIKITIFPAQQLGAAPDHYDMARDGIVDISYTNPGYQAGRFPLYSLIEIPFHMNNAERGAVALHEWYGEIAKTEMADVMFCVANPHDPGTLHSKNPVKVPGDVKGMNVRPAHATMARFISSIGGAPVQVPAPEAREAIAKGAADAITFPWNSVYIFGIDSETKHHLDMPFYVSAQLLLINKASYAGLSEENRKVLDDHCTPEWSGKFSAGWAENEASGRQKMIDSGEHTLYKPTDDEVGQWRAAAQPLIDTWKTEAKAKGADPEKMYQDYLDALTKHNAKF